MQVSDMCNVAAEYCVDAAYFAGPRPDSSFRVWSCRLSNVKPAWRQPLRLHLDFPLEAGFGQVASLVEKLPRGDALASCRFPALKGVKTEVLHQCWLLVLP